MTYKLIREGRFGPGKTWKTGAIVNTYPKPMLVLELDSGGLDIISAVAPSRADYIKTDITSKDIKTITTPDELISLQAKTTVEQAIITCYDFGNKKSKAISDAFEPQADSDSFPHFIKVANLVLTKPCPWKTVVLDNTTSLSNIIMGKLAAVNKGIFSDARKWSPAIGDKIKAVIAEFTCLPCHFVVIMHEATDKNETTGEIRTEPAIYSAYRQLVGTVLSQFFYQTKKNGKPVIITNDNGFIKGLGSRWPEVPNECGVTFNELYGKAVINGEIEKPT